MKRIAAIILTAMLTAAAFTACGQKDDKKPESTAAASTASAAETVTEAPTEAQPATEAATEAAALTADELAPAEISFDAEVNGNKLSVPFAYSELEKLGFSLKEDGELQAQSFSIGVYPENADRKHINVNFLNDTDAAKPYSACKISMVEFKPELGLNVVLPGGLPFDGRATAENIIAKYGEPKNVIEGKGFKIMTYGGDTNNVEFTIHDDPAIKHTDSVKITNRGN